MSVPGGFSVLAALLLAATSVWGRPGLDVEVLSYYEALDYDPAVLRDQHHRVAREVGSKPGNVHLHINAFNRSFASSLSHAKGVFGKSVKFLVGGVETDEYDPRSFYKGDLAGEPGSIVRGHIIDGVFDGIIRSKQGTFYVEQAHKFFKDRSRDFHSIIYHSDDVRVPEGVASCGGAKGKLMEKLNDLASSAVPLHDDKRTLYGEDRYLRLKRQTIGNNRFCPIRVAADHLYLAEVGGGSVVNSMTQIASVIANVQDIYSTTDFDGVVGPDGIQPVIVRLEILDQNMRGYQYGANNIPVDSFLDLWSQEDQSEYCLALLLTHRDFADGVLGLAWVAQPAGGNSGGICENRVRLRTGERSLNTGIVTYLNFGRTQPQSVATITIAHEFGHNFGSPHDPSGSCSPGGSQGNFIMFPQATDGALPNNDEFSSCSRDNIRAVLQTESDCFTATEAFCGNGIIELIGNEECDCGNMCDQDSCCRDNCTLTPGSQCSSVEQCCTSTCQYQPNTFECMPETECGEASFCPGTSGTCPLPDSRRDNGLCNQGRNVCLNGFCAGSICVNRNATDCQCSIAGGNDESTLCHVCCQVGGGPCMSSFDLFDDQGQQREGGRSCNNFEGYCSSATPPMCVIVDNERVLEDLLDFFNLNNLNAIALWLQENWYVPVIIIVVIAGLIFLLHITYRKRTPIKKGISRVRNSTMRRQRTGGAPPSSSQAPPSNGRRRPRAANREISQGEGERRLKQFFPTADRETILAVMRNTRSESKAVQRMIDLGYPLYKVSMPRS